MPTIKPRVQVTLEPETHAVIERFAQLQGRTRGSVIAELLDSVAPSLTRTVALLEAAFEAPKSVKNGLRGVVESLRAELVDASGDASKQLNFVLSQMEQDAQGYASSPHVVTRGSGMDLAPPRKPTKPRSKGSKSGSSATTPYADEDAAMAKALSDLNQAKIDHSKARSELRKELKKHGGKNG